MSSAAEASISIRDLTVRVAGRPLLESARAEFPAGKVTLIIGASGVGKTVLIKVLAGLEEAEVEARGSITIAGRNVLERGGGRPHLGLVFQNLALFDEFDCRRNIEFALDHRRRRDGGAEREARPGGERGGAPGGGPLEAQGLLDEFRIPAATPVQSLSGGQQQRLALARTLAYDPAIIIYDEPTSGLDPANASRVAERIRKTGETHGKTTLVVTHDYGNLARIADCVYLLDPEKRELRRLEGDELDDLAAHLPGTRAFQETASVEVRRGFAGRVLTGSQKVFEHSGAALENAFGALAHLLPFWRSGRWGLRFFLHYLGLVASFSAILYFSFAGLIAGFVSTYFSFKFLPYRLYTEPLIGDEMLRALGLILYRTVVPVLTTVLMAARSGAAVASDIGSRSYSHQLDAMRSFGIRPSSYLLTNILYAFLVATPILVGISFLAARATSLVVFVYNHPAKGWPFWDGNFHHDLRVAGEWLYFGTGWLLPKVLVCGLGVGAIAYYIAARPKKSGVEVSRGITGTIIWATLYVLVVHFAFAFFEFERLR